MPKAALKVVTPPALVKLDLGCGKNKKEGFVGVDARKFDGVDIVLDLVATNESFTNTANPKRPHGGGFKKWPWKDDSVDEVHCSHFVEHLAAKERVHFVNELYRVLKKGCKAAVIVPHWASSRAYGDLTHQWPPVGEMWFYYLDKKWREANAPHNDFYKCDFETTWGYGLHQEIMARNQEYQQFAINFYKEAAQDLHATLTKR
jgi:SAM-dependent methyltransferase